MVWVGIPHGPVDLGLRIPVPSEVVLGLGRVGPATVRETQKNWQMLVASKLSALRPKP